MNILKYRQFKVYESFDPAPLNQKKEQLENQIKQLQTQLLTVQQQLIAGQQQDLAQPGSKPMAPAIQESEGFEDEKFKILDFGFEDDHFWIGLTDNVQDDKEVPKGDFYQFIEQWAKKNNMEWERYAHTEMEHFDDDENPISNIDFEADTFWDEQENETQHDIVQDYLKTHP